MPRHPLARGILVLLAGIALAAWVGLGRALFGIAGDLAIVYTLTLGTLIVVLHLLIAWSVVRAARRGYRHRPATIGTLVTSWACGVLLGLLIPDITATGLQTILTRGEEPALGIAIGFANPLGVITLVFAVVAAVAARGDAAGRAHLPSEEELFD